MEGAARKIKNELLAWTEDVLDESDFYDFCTRRGVLVIETPMKWMGLYLVRRSVPVILTNSSLKGFPKLHVQWHEAGHHILHAPGSCFFNRGTRNKIELEAYMAAACAMIPRPMVIGLSPAEIAENLRYPAQIISFRYYIFRTYNI
jgi:Zn-dependent peptidase ImmA (M78 family)